MTAMIARLLVQLPPKPRCCFVGVQASLLRTSSCFTILISVKNFLFLNYAKEIILANHFVQD